MAFNGVRISWLMLARKADFCLSDVSAFSLEACSSRFISSSWVMSHSMLMMTGEKSLLSTFIFCLSRMRRLPFSSLPSNIQCLPVPVAAISMSSFRFCSASSGG